MTTPTKRPSEDELEARLQASFDRSVKSSAGDLADGQLVDAALRRGSRRTSTGAVWRAGLVLAAVAVLGLGTMWAVGGRPSPSPVPSLALAAPGASDAASPAPTVGGPSEAPYSQVMRVEPGQSFPATFDGQPVYAVGGPAEQYIAKAVDDTPFYVSGWAIPMNLNGCFEGGLEAPVGGVIFSDCAATHLYAGPDGGANLRYFISLRSLATEGLIGLPAADAAHNTQLVVRLHVHDAACAVPDCVRKPVLEQAVVAGTPLWAPGILASTVPPDGLSIADAISSGLAAARDQSRSADVRLVSVAAGPAAVFGNYDVEKDPTTWIWQVKAATTDGLGTITVMFDYVTGTASGYRTQTDGMPHASP